MNSIFVHDALGNLYEIPKTEAEKYAMTRARVKELGHLPLVPPDQLVESVPQGEEAEVSGRHAVLSDGGYGYHLDWSFGPYIWHVDRATYNGWHRHIHRQTPLAIDSDG